MDSITGQKPNVRPWEFVLENLPVLPLVQSSLHERTNKGSSGNINSTDYLKRCSDNYVKPGAIPFKWQKPSSYKYVNMPDTESYEEYFKKRAIKGNTWIPASLCNCCDFNVAVRPHLCRRCLIILSQMTLLSAILLQGHTTASRIEPSWNRRKSDFSPQNARKDFA